MTFNDDEPIVTPDVSGEKPSSSNFDIEGKTKLRIINKTEAPLEACKFKVLLEVKGAGVDKERMGVDLVTVLDVSGSMGAGKGEKLANMKRALQFMIKKLSPIDRLSVVTYSSGAERKCPLRQISEKSQGEIGELVDGLFAEGQTNIGAGLQTGLQVLNDRKLSSGRVVAIMLMSDGKNNRGPDAAQILAGKVPVHTFGFGAGQEPGVLKSIADNSNGGTFSDVHNLDNLSIAFSQCLAGLLTVAVQDLKLTITPQDSIKFEDVSAGNYPQSRENNDAGDSVTVSFGDLYDKEVRKVTVELLLPAVSRRTPGVDVLEVTYAYSVGGERLDGNPVFATITRTDTVEQEREEVKDEVSRLMTAATMKEARELADKKNLKDAKGKLVDAHKLLEDEKPNTLIEMLKTELQMLLSLMASQDIYNKQGRPFALSSETSHARQRFAARGAVELLRLFATPRMDKFLEQALSFDKDPNLPLPTEEEDVEQEIKDYPIQPTPPPSAPTVPIAGVLSHLIHKGIKLLNRIDAELNKSK